MQITTFYSYKGGVGRTLACANFGLYMAKTGRRVVLLDMDFEAPGLDSKFANISINDVPHGLIDQFLAHQKGTEIPEIEAINIPLPEDVSAAGGSLQLIPAGDYTAPDYYRKLSTINWDLLLRDKSGLAFCLQLVDRIKETLKADVLVIDARTGLSEVGGLCTQVLPDTVVLLTSTNKESLEGTKRIYGHIQNSSIVKSRSLRKPEVDLRIVVTRIQRQDNLAELEEKLMSKLDLPIERLYYLFSDIDLSLNEYLALDHFSEQPSILKDYVELFTSMNQEEIDPYIKGRLDSFRSHLTLRQELENERIIQELLTLFPRSDVWLEAARYYSLTKDHPSALVNYCHYLDENPENEVVLGEFAYLCKNVSLSVLSSSATVRSHLRTFGVKSMGPELLGKYFRLVNTDQDRMDIVEAIEEDLTKIEDKYFRTTYFRVLHALKDWNRITEQASERDKRSDSHGLLVAEAYAYIGDTKRSLEFLKGFEPNEEADVNRLLHILFLASRDQDFSVLSGIIDFATRYLHYALRRPDVIEKNGEEFVNWLKAFRKYIKDEHM